jgi:hypothetical protein
VLKQILDQAVQDVESKLCQCVEAVLTGAEIVSKKAAA